MTVLEQTIKGGAPVLFCGFCGWFAGSVCAITDAPCPKCKHTGLDSVNAHFVSHAAQEILDAYKQTAIMPTLLRPPQPDRGEGDE